MQKFDKAGLTQFLTIMTQKGWVNQNTGGALKSAVAKILGDVEADKDVREIDVDMEIRRFNNLHPGDLTAESLTTYGKRVKLAIAHYISWVDDPTKYKPPGRAVPGTAAAKRVDKPKNSGIADVTVTEPIPQHQQQSKPEPVYLATESNLAMPFPLRAGYLAQVVIPRDMTKAEATRLCAFIMTLAVAE